MLWGLREENTLLLMKEAFSFCFKEQVAPEMGLGASTGWPGKGQEESPGIRKIYMQRH